MATSSLGFAAATVGVDAPQYLEEEDDASRLAALKSSLMVRAELASVVSLLQCGTEHSWNTAQSLSASLERMDAWYSEVLAACRGNDDEARVVLERMAQWRAGVGELAEFLASTAAVLHDKLAVVQSSLQVHEALPAPEVSFLY